MIAAFETELLNAKTSGTIPVGHPQRACGRDLHRLQSGNGQLQQRLRRQPLVHRRRCAARPAAAHPTGVDGRPARSRVHGLPGEQGLTDDIVGSPNAPYLNSIIDAYGSAANYYALTHPSDPNYYPILGGSDFGTNYNCPANCFDQPNLADSIEAAGLTWAGYAEGGGGYTTPTDRLPFLAFSDIYNDPTRVADHLFDLTQLGQDLEVPADAPNFVWFAADDATNMEGPTDTVSGVIRWAISQLTPMCISTTSRRATSGSRTRCPSS